MSVPPLRLGVKDGKIVIETPFKPVRERRETLSPEAERARGRHPDYENLSPQKQWEEDKRLGILDWDGS